MKKFVNLYGHPYAIQSKSTFDSKKYRIIFLNLDHLSDEQLWTRFCDTFRFVLDYPRVSYSEFLNVYEALNIAVDQDDDFIHLVNNTWNI
jgi:hypothetical protein